MLLVGVAFYFTPHYAVQQMQKAAEARDAATLAAYVDFPAFKESLKGQFQALVAAKRGQSNEHNPFQALGTGFAAALINPIIDAFVTPDSLALLLRGVTPSLSNSHQTTPTKGAVVETETSKAYESVNRFVVTITRKGATDAPVVLVLHRHHLVSWKLSGLRLPNVGT